jgi:hypothetical protein
VTDADIKKFEQEHGIPITKVSAKSGLMVDDSFLDMTKKLIVKKNNSSSEDNKKSVGLKKLREALEGSKSAAGNTCCSS